MNEEAPSGQGKRTRSPSYPGIGLRQAVDRAAVLYEADKRNWTHVDTALHHWGYRPKSGAGLVVIAALKNFGLIIDEGSGTARRVKVSEDGLRLLLLDEQEHAVERQRLLKEAALRPRIHRFLWDEFQGSLPSDATLRVTLLTKLSFTDGAVREFIPQFRDTVAYAGLTSSDTLTGTDDDRGGESDEGDTAPAWPPSLFPSVDQMFGRPKVTPVADEAPPKVAPERVLQFPIPLPDTDALAALQVPARMSEVAWNQMMAIINAYKPSIVRHEAEAKPTSESDPTS